MKRTPLKRSPMMRRKVKSTSYARRERGVEYMGWVRTQPCAIYAVGVPRADRVLLLALPCSGPVQADHAGVRIAGFGTKSRDRDCIPLCMEHHRQRTEYDGLFAGLTNEQRREWCARVIEETQRRAWLSSVEVPNA